MSVIIELEVFSFKELSDSAKDRARDWYNTGCSIYDADYANIIENILHENFTDFEIDTNNIYSMAASYNPSNEYWVELALLGLGDEDLLTAYFRLDITNLYNFNKNNVSYDFHDWYTYSKNLSVVKRVEELQEKISEDMLKRLEEFASEFNREAKIIEDYFSSDEYIDMVLEDNGCLFFEDGSKYC